MVLLDRMYQPLQQWCCIPLLLLKPHQTVHTSQPFNMDPWSQPMLFVEDLHFLWYYLHNFSLLPQLGFPKFCIGDDDVRKNICWWGNEAKEVQQLKHSLLFLTHSQRLSTSQFQLYVRLVYKICIYKYFFQLTRCCPHEFLLRLFHIGNSYVHRSFTGFKPYRKLYNMNKFY